MTYRPSANEVEVVLEAFPPGYIFPLELAVRTFERSEAAWHQAQTTDVLDALVRDGVFEYTRRGEYRRSQLTAAVLPAPVTDVGDGGEPRP